MSFLISLAECKNVRACSAWIYSCISACIYIGRAAEWSAPGVSCGSKSVWETEAVIAAAVWIAWAACARCQRCGDGFGFSCALCAGYCASPSAAGFLPLPFFIHREKKEWWKIWHLKHFICSFPSPLSTSDISIIYCLQWMSVSSNFLILRNHLQTAVKHAVAFFSSSPSSTTHYLSRDEGACTFFFSSLVRERPTCACRPPCDLSEMVVARR